MIATTATNELFLFDVNFYFGLAGMAALFIVGLFFGWWRLGKRGE
jgi:hypothetical protein